MKRFSLAVLAVIFTAGPLWAQPKRLADRDIVEAYEYMLGRLLVLRQENLEFQGRLQVERDRSPRAGRRRLGQPEPRRRL